jgi:hypothetical protein
MDDAAAMRFVCEEHWRQQLEARRILREEYPENELSAKKIWRERKSGARHARFRVIGGRHCSIKKNIPKRACSFNDAQWYYFLATPFSISPSFKFINCIQVHPFHCNNSNNSNSRHYDCHNPIPPNATLAPSSSSHHHCHAVNATNDTRHAAAATNIGSTPVTFSCFSNNNNNNNVPIIPSYIGIGSTKLR